MNRLDIIAIWMPRGAVDHRRHGRSKVHLQCRGRRGAALQLNGRRKRLPGLANLGRDTFEAAHERTLLSGCSDVNFRAQAGARRLCPTPSRVGAVLWHLAGPVPAARRGVPRRVWSKWGRGGRRKRR